MAATKVKNVNVLCLDGGGVRGLSTLIILAKLMSIINEAVDLESRNDKPLMPGDIFDLVVGTSTGGLIALMIVKLGFDVDTCIQLYEELSKEIFSRSHWFGKVTGGFGRVKKFSGKHLRDVLVKKVIMPGLQKWEAVTADNYHLEEIERHRELSCAVVCHELDRETMDRLDDPEMLLCSHRDQVGTASLCHHRCRHQYGGSDAHVLVADAARATSAAPTYFSHVDILGKFLVDGGFGYTNNPSYATWHHYFELRRANYERVNLVNLGTGSKPKGHRDKKGWFDYFPNTLVPGFVKTMQTLAALATDSEQVGRHMHSIELAGDTLKFSRFSANTGGIHAIELHEYERMDEIVKSTNDYLEDEAVLADLNRVARELVDAWRARRQVQTVPTNGTTSTQLETVPEDRPLTKQKIVADQHQASETGSVSVSGEAAGDGSPTASSSRPASETLLYRSPDSGSGDAAHANIRHTDDIASLPASATPKLTSDTTEIIVSSELRQRFENRQQPTQDHQFLSATPQDGPHPDVSDNSPEVTPDRSRNSSTTRSEASTFHDKTVLNLDDKKMHSQEPAA